MVVIVLELQITGSEKSIYYLESIESKHFIMKEMYMRHLPWNHNCTTHTHIYLPTGRTASRACFCGFLHWFVKWTQQNFFNVRFKNLCRVSVLSKSLGLIFRWSSVTCILGLPLLQHLLQFTQAVLTSPSEEG